MNNITLDDLLKEIIKYDIGALNIVKKAYNYADILHNGQTRQSGEAYITHPLNVAYILAIMHADCDTLCAALLHDTLEDTKATKEDIKNEFNEDVANLVDGVTKISKMNFSSKQEQNYANTRKIISSVTSDVRIIIIKLADRLHNMRTLSFKSEFKQKENAQETIDIFVPLAYYIGAYRIKSELEDLSLKYLNPRMYQTITDKKGKIEEESKECLQEMLSKITEILNNKNISNDIKVRTKNLYGIYKRLNEGRKWSDIHDLLALKIIVNEIDECYRTLGIVHTKYHMLNSEFKDFISNPKTNMYQSLHTTVFGEDDRMVQMRIRTKEMEAIDAYGLTAYWDINKGNAREVMQEKLKEHFQFYKSLVEIGNHSSSNESYVHLVKTELFSDVIHVFTSKGDILELPKGSNLIDFAYRIHTDLGNHIIGGIINGEERPINYELKNGDIVSILVGENLLIENGNWEDSVKTTRARRKIRELKKNC